MSKVTIELNSTNIGKLLKSDHVKEMLKSEAEKHANGWKTDTRYMGTRLIASIYSTDSSQIEEELDGHRIAGGLA